MNKLLITRWNRGILSVLLDGRKALSLTAEPEGEPSLLNHIYIGKVQKVVSNIQAAFIEIAPGKTGYYDLKENRPLVLNRPGAEKLKPGDELAVQVVKDAVKTKAPVLTSDLSLAGKYCVLTAHRPGIGFSSKLTDREWKEKLRPALEEQIGGLDFGLIVRTNAIEADAQAIFEELKSLMSQYQAIQESANHRTCFSCLYQPPASYISGLRDLDGRSLETILTDQKDLYDQLKQYLTSCQPEDLAKLKWYEDPMVSLNAFYSLERILGEAISSRVWLKSGGYLVIEPTEAMTVIDVNTGKYSGKKTMRETLLKINLEAAQEIGNQLRLRNLSGIIMVDFIDMADQEDKDRLMESLREIVRRDPVKTTVVDMTRLNLVEITRKKVRRPLHEMLQEL